MKLRAIRVRDVKGFGDSGKAIEGLGDGLNVLAAENEFGKSTLFEALRVVLYEKHNRNNKDTKALRPYDAKGGPTIEVDIETDAGRFRLHKRFLSRATASVVDLATGRAIASGDDVQDWIIDVLGAAKSDDGPTGLLWVAQGQSLEQPKATETSGALLSSLIEQTVREVTGGARVRAVLGRAESTLATLVTPGRGQPTQRYGTALKTRSALQADIKNLEQRLHQAETTRQDLTRLQVEVDALDNAQALLDQKQKLKAITEKLASVQQISKRLEGLSRELQLTEDTAVRVKNDLKELEAAQSDAQLNRASAEEISKKITQQNAAHQKRKEKYETAVAAESKQKQAVHDTKVIVEHTRKATKAHAAEARLETAQIELDRAEAVGRELAEATKTREAIHVDRAALEKLDHLRLAVDRAEACRQAGQTKVSVSYAHAAENKVRVDGHALGDQEQRPVDGRLVLDVDTVGQIIIDAGEGSDSTQTEQETRTAQDALKAKLAELGVRSLTEARDAAEQRAQAEADVRSIQAELHRFAPEGIPKLRAARDALSRLVVPHAEAAESTLSEEEAEARLRAAENALETCRNARYEAENELRASEHVLRGYEAERQRLAQTQEQVRTRFGPEESWQSKQSALKATLAKHKDDVATKTKEKTELEKQSVGADDLAVEKKTLEAELAQRADRVSGLKTQAATLIGALGEIEKDGVGERHAEACGALARIENQVAALESEKRALETLIETLKTVESNAQDQFFAPVMEELHPLLHQVMPDSELKLSASFAPDHIVRDGLEEPFADLSGGTREQIAVLTRLAFARLMARKGRRMPVILDDALVYSDDARIERMFQALQIAAGDIQLIVLTCRQKTFQDLGGTTLKLVDWQEA